MTDDDDIVEKLRVVSVHGRREQAIHVMEQAAKEIIRLRAAVEARTIRYGMTTEIILRDEDIDRISEFLANRRTKTSHSWTAEDRRMDGELETEIIRLRAENERLKQAMHEYACTGSDTPAGQRGTAIRRKTGND